MATLLPHLRLCYACAAAAAVAADRSCVLQSMVGPGRPSRAPSLSSRHPHLARHPYCTSKQHSASTRYDLHLWYSSSVVCGDSGLQQDTNAAVYLFGGGVGGGAEERWGVTAAANWRAHGA